MEINEYLMKIFQVAKQMENLGFFKQGKRLNQTEFRLLREIIMEQERGRKIISSELARRLGITRSAISQLVTKLEERNIVKRVESPVDKKIAYIQMSDEAFGVFETQCKEANEIMQKVVSEFGEERIEKLIAEYDEFSAIMQKVVDAKK